MRSLTLAPLRSLLPASSPLLSAGLRLLFFRSPFSSSSSSSCRTESQQNSCDEESKSVRISVWWDYENCSIPDGVNAYRISNRILSALRSNGIQGPVSINAFGDMSQEIPYATQEALSSTGIGLIDVSDAVQIDCLDFENGDGPSLDAIHIAAREGARDNLLEQLDSGVSVNLKEGEGNTPLHWAVDCGHLNIVKELLKTNADVNAKRHNPWRNKEKVLIGCGAGFCGDRPKAALKLLESVPELDYLVLECLAERTLADKYKKMMLGGEGYDPRIQEWMSLLLPLAVQRGVCIITNMGAVDTSGAQKAVLGVATDLGLKITVSVAYEIPPSKTEEDSSKHGMNGASTYLGSAPIVHCLEKYNPHVVITSRVADAALFLAPMIYEFGWRQHEFELLAKGALAGHLLECGCQLTGGYFMHPGDEYRDMPFEKLLDISLPFAEIDYRGDVYLSKAEGSGGELSVSTCAQQLLYEIADPSCYITPDVVIDLREVSFHEVSEDRIRCQGAKASNSLLPEKLLQLVPADCGYKGWGEISYGGQGCVRRAQAAEFLVRSWVNETYPGIGDQILSYIIGHDSLKIPTGDDKQIGSNGENTDIRLRMDGLFELEQHANCFYHEFMALYTNGPAGGGGITVGLSKEIILHKQLVERENVFWRTDSDQTNPSDLHPKTSPICTTRKQSLRKNYPHITTTPIQPAPSGVKIPLYKVAHSRAGDKANDINFSVIPHFSSDINRLKKVITQDRVKNAVSPLFYSSTISQDQALENDLEGVIVEIYEVSGISSLNVVVRNVLDGGVNCSRRIDRHGKTISDLILSQEIVLP